MDLHMLTEGTGVRVRFITAPYFAVIGLVTCMHMRVLFSVAAVSKTSVAAFKLAFKGFFT